MSGMLIAPSSVGEMPLLGEGDCRRRVKELVRSGHLRAGIAVIDPGCMAPLHAHEFADEINVALKGQGTFVCGGEEREFKEGDVMYTPSGEKHQHINRGSRPFWLFWAYCPPTRLPGER